MDANTTLPASDITTAILALDSASWFVLAITLCVFFGPLFVLFPPFPPRRSDALWQTHSKLGSSGKSPKTSTNKQAANDNQQQPRVKSLFIYPVKYGTGIEVTRAKVFATGLEFDGIFTLAQLKSPFPVSVEKGKGDDSAKDHKWESISQQQFPQLAHLQVELWQPDLDKLKGLNDKNAQSNSEAFLILRFPWRASGFFGFWDLFAAKCLRGWRAVVEKEILLPVEYPSAEDIAAKEYTRATVRVGAVERKEEDALDMSVELPEELRLYLGVSNKLGIFRASSATLGMEVATTTKLSAPGLEKAGRSVPVVGFHDSYPVRIVNASSATTFKSEQTGKTKDQHEGTHVLISGFPAHAEHEWRRIKVKPEPSSQDAEIVFEGVPPQSGLGVHMTPQFEQDSVHGFIEVGMSVEVPEL